MASFAWKSQPALIKRFHEKKFGIYFHRSHLGISTGIHSVYLAIIDMSTPDESKVMGLPALPTIGPYKGPYISEYLPARKRSNNQAQIYFDPGRFGVVGASPRIITITTPGIQDEVTLE